MNKIYDKLILAVALLLLAGGVYLYLQKKSATPTLNAPVDVQPAENPYVPQEVPIAATHEASWPAVQPQSTGWRYDVFTPPKIFIDEDGQFSEEGWKPPLPPPPFGIYLAAIERQPYRLQLEGYIEEDRSDPSKSLLLLYDEEADEQVRARVGTVQPEAEFKLLDFDIQRIRDEYSNVEVVAQATILDQRTEEEVVLTHGERKYDSGVTVIFRSDQDRRYEKVLSEAPVWFEGPVGMYRLLEINLEDSSVTVEKQASQEQEERITRILEARAAATPSPPIETPSESTNSTENISEAPESLFDLF